MKRSVIALAVGTILCPAFATVSATTASAGVNPGNGPFTWKNAANDQYLDQEYTDGVPHPTVLTWGLNGEDNQKWYLETNSDGTKTFVNLASGQCLDQEYTGGVPHPAVLAYDCHGGDNQRWW